MAGSVMLYNSRPLFPTPAMFPQSWRPMARTSWPLIETACMSSMDVSVASSVEAIITGADGLEMSMMSTPVPGQAPRHLPTNARFLKPATSPCTPRLNGAN